MRTIHCLNPISKVGLDTLPKNYQITTELQKADAILVRSASMHDMVLPESVLAVARAGAGFNSIPFENLAKQGVVVFNTPGANANAVKELIIAGMLLASRDIYGGIQWLNNNKTDDQIAKTVEKAKAQFGGTEIFNKTIGIIGLGAIGKLLARACSALGMKVIGTDAFLDSVLAVKDTLPSDMVFVKTNAELYPKCDFISVNVPLMPETKYMINKAAFSQMKDGVVLLNFARDLLVNDDDLKEAIQSKKVRKYVTDFPNNQTAQMEGVIAIPHLGASTEEAEDNCAVMAVHQIVEYIENGNIINSVNYPNLNAGTPKRKSRLSMIYEMDKNFVELAKKIAECGNKVIQFIHVEKNGFGYAIIDCDHEIDHITVDAINNLAGMIKVRKIK
ncbi:MAG: 3-phosphoglycerate dehydrogenase [Tenericutes bacterium GWA2_38_26]|nr:MAG: 3-phosphoglycerate dehydrogenase [Tenericutes bacterium GWA2_38_26]